eukprot:4445307-Prymnesium_polylepis.1
MGASFRPPYAVGQSMCLSLPGFKPLDIYPTRSPLVVADFLVNEVANRSFVEVGPQAGDGLACVSHFAQRAVGIETWEPACRQLQARGNGGFKVVCRELAKGNIDEVLPEADVFYWWAEP